MKYKKYSNEELNRMEQSTIPLTKRNLAGIVFGYAKFSAGPESPGEYGGFSVILFENRIVEVREYLFPEIFAEERRYCVPLRCISEIKQQYQKYHEKIWTMRAPDNGSLDGAYISFYFGDRWIHTQNIEYTDEQRAVQIRKAHPNPAEFEKIMAVVREENKIMKCFFSVCEVLRKYNITLDQNPVTIHGESITDYFEFYGYDENDC
ncbi:MAG: hypothetical protein K2J71_01685 [Oscillospiraceae bacterium]|nr:hypothetical protein [Oscillospiraceae bacterium]